MKNFLIKLFAYDSRELKKLQEEATRLEAQVLDCRRKIKEILESYYNDTGPRRL